MTKRVASQENVGMRYGQLTVLSYLPGKHSIFTVRCDCGKSKKVSALNVVHGRTKSCGCSTGTSISSAKRQASLENRPSKGTKVGTKTILDPNLFTCGGRAACSVKCRCGTVSVVALKLLRKNANSCRTCNNARLTSKSINSRPAKGTVYGSLIVTDPAVYIESDQYHRVAACLVKCACGSEFKVRIRQGGIQAKSCHKCSTVRAHMARKTNSRKKHLIKADRFRQKSNSSNQSVRGLARHHLLEWCVQASKANWSPPLGGGWHKPLIEFHRYHHDLLFPTNVRLKSIWPWDDEGKTIPGLSRMSTKVKKK